MFTLASNIAPKSTQWLWYPFIPAGEMTVLAAPGGVGKGLVGADIAARVSTGRDWPMSEESAPFGNVLWFEAEDRINTTVVPRLIAAKAERGRIGIEKNPQEFYQLKRGTLRLQGVKLIVLSPLFSFVQLRDINNELEVRSGLERLAIKIDDLQCAILAIMHPNKKIDLAAIERLLGSVAFGNYVRSVLLLSAEDTDNRTARLVHAKFNLSIKGDDLLFTKVNRRPTTNPRGQYIGIDWQRAAENIDAGDAFARKRINKSAAQWLKSYLADREWHELPDIIAAAAAAGHSEDTLKKAKQRSRWIRHKSEGFSRDRKTWWRVVRGVGG
jgi:hypothetical protein